ncbi:MAG: hypothetical protein QX203_03975 [Methylococcaceae bacterium]
MLRCAMMSYRDYPELLTDLIFLKMADEYSRSPYNRKVDFPAEYHWQSPKAECGVYGVTLLRTGR